MLGVAGVVVGTVAHLAVLLGGPLAWMEPISQWLTPRAVVCIVLLVVIRLLKRDWVWPRRDFAARRGWWPPGRPAWTKWMFWSYMGYALVQWFRGGGPTPLALTALWMLVYGNILLASLYLLTAPDQTGLDTPGDSFGGA